MPPPSKSAALHLQVLSNRFFVVQSRTDIPPPTSVLEQLTNNRASFFSATRTSEELSLVGEWYDGIPQEYEEKCTWKCIKIRGPMEHSLTGILAAFTATLKAAKIPVFALSTWNTDYVLVPMEMEAASVEALTRDEWIFASTDGEEQQ